MRLDARAPRLRSPHPLSLGPAPGQRLAACSVIGYAAGVIRTFRHKGLRNLFETGRSGRSGRIDPRLILRLGKHLDRLNLVEEPADLPNVGLHELKGDRAGTWSLWVSGNWRLTFKFEDRDVWDVDLEDYH